jgi:DMSO reductase anchor subunit
VHPAFSVIFLTTLIGAGQGLFLALYTAQSYAAFGLLPAQDGAAFHGPGSLMVLLLMGAGLAASFFHLGRPERAWRAAAQWRTSWLSREVIVLPAFMGSVFLYGLLHWLGWNPALARLSPDFAVSPQMLVGSAAMLLAFALFVCTGMIYACLRFIQEWHTPLTVINFILLGTASGFVLAAAFSSTAAPDLDHFFTGWALALTLAAAVFRVAALMRNRRLTPRSTLQTAIGVKHPRIAQKSQGFLGGSFNTREFFHGQGAGVLRGVKWLFLALVFVLPAILLATALAEPAAGPLWATFLLQYAGLLAERWFFFAQANHPQNLYYQAVA